MKQIALIAHNLRSCHNVGSLLRTADGLGVRVYLTGYTPYPLAENDNRLPHLAKKVNTKIQKTALGAELSADWRQQTDVLELIASLKNDSFKVCALEQSPKSIELNSFRPPNKTAIIVGSELEGIENDVLKICDLILEIPMRGKKESFNVTQAAAMTLYYLTNL